MHPKAALLSVEKLWGGSREGYLQTVHGQPSPRFRRSVLEFRDDRVVYFLLLLSQKLRTNGIESIAPKFVLSLHKLQKIELQPSFHWRFFGVTLPISLRRKVGIFCLCLG